MIDDLAIDRLIEDGEIEYLIVASLHRSGDIGTSWRLGRPRRSDGAMVNQIARSSIIDDQIDR